MDLQLSRTCSKCFKKKDPDKDFYHANTKSGRKPKRICKECLRAYQRQYYHEEPEYFRDKSRAYYEEAKDVILARAKRNREVNPNYGKKRKGRRIQKQS